MAEIVKVRIWKAGGWHAHVKFPDGKWERHVWEAWQYFGPDALVANLMDIYGRENVEVHSS